MSSAKMNESGLIGVIGGSCLYQMDGLANIKELTLDTPFGKPSDAIVSGQLDGSDVLFIPRHGRNHSLTPSEVNYRANIFALKMLGARWCISISAVGSLKEAVAPSHILIPDQLIDRTTGRSGSFFGEGLVAHVSMADPYCPVLRRALFEAALDVGNQSGFEVHDGGTYVCMEGPAFSSRAESNMHRMLGGAVIGMTNLPEAKLAREAEIAYASVALVTDYDCWKHDGDDVDVQKVVAIMKAQGQHAKCIIANAVKRIASLSPSTVAAQALKNAFLTDLKDVPAATIAKLGPIVAGHVR